MSSGEKRWCREELVHVAAEVATHKAFGRRIRCGSEQQIPGPTNGGQARRKAAVRNDSCGWFGSTLSPASLHLEWSRGAALEIPTSKRRCQPFGQIMAGVWFSTDIVFNFCQHQIMANAKATLAKKTLRLLTRGMAEPRITASALKATRAKARHEQRELVIIDFFHGYECSWCGCRFPETVVPDGDSLFEKRHLAKVVREKQFLDHVCSESHVA